MRAATSDDNAGHENSSFQWPGLASHPVTQRAREVLASRRRYTVVSDALFRRQNYKHIYTDVLFCPREKQHLNLLELTPMVRARENIRSIDLYAR